MNDKILKFYFCYHSASCSCLFLFAKYHAIDGELNAMLMVFILGAFFHSCYLMIWSKIFTFIAHHFQAISVSVLA
jgi:hypothetical protein